MAKVILVDNFDRESVADELLAENLTDEEAKSMADKYNKSHSDYHCWFARAVEDSHKLWRGILELV